MKKARKGVAMTTSCLTDDAKEYSTKIDSKVVLIDGRRLAQLMIDNNIGVSTVARYDLKKTDSDCFCETNE